LLVVLTIAPPSASSGSLGQEVRALEQHAHEPVEEIFGVVLEHRHLAEACVVDQEVERVAIPVVADRGNDGAAKLRERLAAAAVER
jgi:hypothetical protein